MVKFRLVMQAGGEGIEDLFMMKTLQSPVLPRVGETVIFEDGRYEGQHDVQSVWHKASEGAVEVWTEGVQMVELAAFFLQGRNYTIEGASSSIAALRAEAKKLKKIWSSHKKKR